jgi:hypothetical protein
MWPASLRIQPAQYLYDSPAASIRDPIARWLAWNASAGFIPSASSALSASGSAAGVQALSTWWSRRDS